MIKWIVMGGLALLVGGVWLLGELSRADRDAAGQIVTAGEEYVMDLRLGDCVLALGLETEDVEQTQESVRVVPCEEPHIYEVFAVDPGAFSNLETPQTAVFNEQGDAYCYQSFPAFTGVSPETAQFTYTFLYPTQESWRRGDRELTCLLHYEDYGLWQGTARG